MEERVALVTGASSGIGRATAVALAMAGMRVVVAARRSERLEEVASAIAVAGGEARVLTADVADRGEVEEMVDRAVAEFGRLDVLVNNAGVGHWEPIETADVDAWQREIDVNLRAAMVATHRAVPMLRADGGGDVVNISSLTARFPAPGWPGYAATKAALNQFSHSIAAGLRPQGIRVTLVETGQVATEMQSDDDIAATRMLEPEDVADAIVYAVTCPAHVSVRGIQLVALPYPSDEELTDSAS